METYRSADIPNQRESPAGSKNADQGCGDSHDDCPEGHAIESEHHSSGEFGLVNDLFHELGPAQFLKLVSKIGFGWGKDLHRIEIEKCLLRRALDIAWLLAGFTFIAACVEHVDTIEVFDFEVAFDVSRDFRSTNLHAILACWGDCLSRGRGW